MRGFAVAQRRVIESQFLRLVPAQVVHHDVSALHQAPERGAPGRVLEVERDTLLVQVERLEELTVVFAEEIRPHAALWHRRPVRGFRS
jgi:hypothetical protein